MKFVCDQCLSKYTIADDKVRGKILKIRCVKCGNLVEIRDETAKKAEKPEKPEKASSPLEERFASSFKPPAGTPSRPPPSSAGTPGLRDAMQKSARKIEREDIGLAVWFAAIDNEPVGPISARAVAEHRRAGRVADDSLVWREGMDDWIALASCKELIGLLARVDLEGSSASRAQPPRVAPRLGLLSPGDRASMPPLDSPLRGRGLGAAADRPEAVASMLPADPLPASPVASPAKTKADPPPPAAPSAEDAFFGGDGRRATTASLAPPRHAGMDKWVKIAAVGFFAVAIVVLGVILFSGEDKAEPQVVEKVVEKVVERERIVYRDREVRTDDDLGSGTDADRAGRKAGKGAKVKAASEPDSAEEKKRKLLEELGASGASASSKGAGGGQGGAGLSDKDFSTVVGKNKGTLQICYEQAMKKGEAPSDRDLKVLVALTVGGTGMVKRVSVGGPGASYESLKGCIESAAKKWLFPSSSGESSAEFPFLFTPK